VLVQNNRYHRACALRRFERRDRSLMLALRKCLGKFEAVDKCQGGTGAEGGQGRDGTQEKAAPVHRFILADYLPVDVCRAS
jgi:hypothetical protein